MTRISWKGHRFRIAIDGFFFAQESFVDGIMCAEGFGIHNTEHQVIVSHLASGKAIARFAGIGTAFRYVEEVAPLAALIEDWHSAECEVSPEHVAQFQGIANAVVMT